MGVRVDPSIERNLRLIARFIDEGTVIPFLGAGVNLMSRAADEHYRRGTTLPSGTELAADLASYFEYPETTGDLMRISQYVDLMAGSAELYRRLHALFDADYPPTALHRLLAAVPKLLRDRDRPGGFVIVTTNYDDALERALVEAGEPFELVFYIADGPDRGRFAHVQADGTPRTIDRPNEYDGLSVDDCPVIAKLHGAVSRIDPDQDSYVITEDHYIDYLTRTEISDLMPVQLVSRLKRSHFLFLGYSLEDWDQRVILHRIWTQQRLPYNSWAVQLDPDEIDRKRWERHGVELIHCGLDDYVAGLGRALEQQRMEAIP